MTRPTQNTHHFPMCRTPLAALLLLSAAPASADPDARDGMPEPLPASGVVSGTLLPILEKNLRCAALGDFGYPGPGAESVAAMIRSWEPAFILTTGDNTYGPVDYADILPATPGIQTGWDEYVGRFFGDWILRRADGRYESLTGNRQRFFPCVGNHENTLLSGEYVATTIPPPIEGYLDYFFQNPGGSPRLPTGRGARHDNNTSYYALRSGMVDFFFLDSNQSFVTDGTGAGILDSQSDWLEREASASTARWKIAVFHHPPPRAWQSWPWLPAERMARCHLILAGHDHVYERFPWHGVPVLVTGNGGAPLRQRFTPFYPDTQSVDDRRYGALNIHAGPEYLEIESRSLDPATGEEILADRFLLGDAAAIPDDDDEYAFHATAGESITLETSTPGPQPDPALTLYRPDGRVAARDSGSAPDGRNARLTVPLDATGRWKIRVIAENVEPGAYTLTARLHRPGGTYAAWLDSQSPSPAGILPPLVEFALTRFDHKSPARGLELLAVPGVSAVRLQAPDLMRQGVTFAAETALHPAGPWTVIVEHRPFAPWRSPAGLPFNILPSGEGLQTIQMVISGGTKRFFRLRAALSDEE